MRVCVRATSASRVWAVHHPTRARISIIVCPPEMHAGARTPRTTMSSRQRWCPGHCAATASLVRFGRLLSIASIECMGEIGRMQPARMAGTHARTVAHRPHRRCASGCGRRLGVGWPLSTVHALEYPVRSIQRIMNSVVNNLFTKVNVSDNMQSVTINITYFL